MCFLSTDVGSPPDVNVCIGGTDTTFCPFEYYDRNDSVVPHWRIYNGSGKLLFTLNGNESKNGFYYPLPGMNDSKAKLIVWGDPKIDGYRVMCRLALINQPIDSPDNGTIKVIGML